MGRRQRVVYRRLDELFFFDDDFFDVDFRDEDFLEPDFFAADFLDDDFLAVLFLVDDLFAVLVFEVFFRVRAAFFAEALRFFFAVAFDLPRAEPLFTAAQARRSASSSLTPFSS